MTLSRRTFLESLAAASALGALGDLSGMGRALAAAPPTRWVKGVCRYCGTGCGLYMGVEDGRVTAVRGDRKNHNRGLLCVKGFLLPQILRAPTRLTHPLVRKDGELVRASWDEALGRVAERFAAAIRDHGPDSVGFYGSGQALTEETYVANKLFKAGIRTNNVEGNPRLCMASAVGGYVTTFGKDEPMGCYEDLDAADVFFIIGSNMAEAHPVLFQRVVQRKEADPSVKVIVADPRRTPTSRIADLHIHFRPGTDLAILNALAHVILREGMADEEFVRRHVTVGKGKETGRDFGDYRKFLAAYAPEQVEGLSGARAEDVVTAARWIGAPGRTVTSLWTMGLNQRTRGVWANNLVHNLHLLTGKIGVPGSTPLSLTGQPNACGGVRDGGALSHLLPYGRLVADGEDRREMERLWGVPEGTIQPKPGLPTIDLFRALEAGDVKCLYVLCTNPGQSLPDVDRYRAAMEKEDSFLVVAEAYHPTRTSELADVVLPAALWAEKEGVYGCTERRYQLLERAVDPPGEARPDLEILVELGRRLGHGELVDFDSPAAVWEEILRVCEGTAYDFTGATRERLAASHGLLWPIPSKDHPGTRRRYVRGDDPLVPADHPHRIHFYGRPDGKAVVWMRPQDGPAEGVDAEYPVVYTTGRVIEHWHTGTMTSQVRELRGSNYRAYAEISPQDAERWKLADGDRVRVTSRRGSEEFPVRVVDNGATNLVFVHMHDPDRMCNRVTLDEVDPGSKQPEFKIAAVKLEKVS